jgi:hypothetical protein
VAEQIETLPALCAEIGRLRDGWQRVADMNRKLGWPSQAQCVSLPTRAARDLTRLLARVAGEPGGDDGG